MIDAPVNVISPRVRETYTAGLQNVSAGSATTELALPKLLKRRFRRQLHVGVDVRLARHRRATPMVLTNVVCELFQAVVNEDGPTRTLVKLFESNAGAAIAPLG